MTVLHTMLVTILAIVSDVWNVSLASSLASLELVLAIEA